MNYSTDESLELQKRDDDWLKIEYAELNTHLRDTVKNWFSLATATFTLNYFLSVAAAALFTQRQSIHEVGAFMVVIAITGIIYNWGAFLAFLRSKRFVTRVGERLHKLETLSGTEFFHSFGSIAGVRTNEKNEIIAEKGILHSLTCAFFCSMLFAWVIYLSYFFLELIAR